MKAIAPGAISRAAQTFLPENSHRNEPRPPGQRRERSWDLCFSHFQANPSPTEAMEASCLHLGYYLASWGMLRGSSYLFRETNLLHYREAIAVIELHNPQMRGWDVPEYLDPDRQRAFAAAWEDLNAVLLPEGGSSLTLVSKVMMGVWGCVPSFDTYFRATFKRLSESRHELGAWNMVSGRSLSLLHEVYRSHAPEIEAVQAEFPVWDFETAGPTTLTMPIAKILDIFGFHASWKAPTVSADAASS